jgi:hypothetical protein
MPTATPVPTATPMPTVTPTPTPTPRPLTLAGYFQSFGEGVETSATGYVSATLGSDGKTMKMLLNYADLSAVRKGWELRDSEGKLVLDLDKVEDVQEVFINSPNYRVNTGQFSFQVSPEVTQKFRDKKISVVVTTERNANGEIKAELK